MGTGYSVKLGENPDETVLEELERDIRQQLAAINAKMSTYIPASEISRFNESESVDWIPVSVELVEIVSLAQVISEQTAGAFDTTVHGLVTLWGFGAAGSVTHPPSKKQLASLLETTGFERIDWRRAPPALRKHHPELELDLSAIAKGYAVDKVAETVEQAGINNYLVEIGGEIRVKGGKTESQGWRIAIQLPDARSGSPHRTMTLSEGAVATSGDYQNYFEADSKRYSHAIDPRSGRPISHALASVTVISEDCATADGLATALLVMGPEQGLAFAAANNIPALFISRGDGGFLEWATDSFKRLLSIETEADAIGKGDE